MKKFIFVATGLLMIAGAAGAQTTQETAAEDAAAQADRSARNRYFLAAANAPGDTVSAWRLASALEWPMAGGPEAIAAARAVRVAHPIAPDDDPMAVSVRLRDKTLPFPVAERAKAIDTLLAAAADNAYFGLILLSEPEFKDDVAAGESLFQLTAHAPGYDAQYASQVAALIARLAQAPSPPPSANEPLAVPDAVQQLTAAGALVTMDAMPAWTPVTRLCKASAGTLQADCQALGQMMLDQADTVFELSIGAAVLRISATTGAQKQVAQQAGRRLKWQMENGSPVPRPGTNDVWREMTIYRETLLAKNELAAITAVLQARGLPLEPPATWVSRYPASNE